MNCSRPPPSNIPAIVRAAYRWTCASLALERATTILERTTARQRLRVAFDCLVASTLEDDSRYGDYLFATRNYDRWPNIFGLA